MEPEIKWGQNFVLIPQGELTHVDTLEKTAVFNLAYLSSIDSLHLNIPLGKKLIKDNSIFQDSYPSESSKNKQIHKLSEWGNITIESMLRAKDVWTREFILLRK